MKAMLDEFDQEVGLHYLRAIHLNDSKGTSMTSTVLYKGRRGAFVRSQAFTHSHCSNSHLVGKLGCNLDRHEDIGKGCIGISAFRDIVNEPRLDNIPLILETPGR